MGSDDHILLYVAIDFGTTYSGCAFRFKQATDVVVCKKLGGEGLGFQSYKVPTCVLTDKDDNFVAFGFEAQQKYTNRSDNDDDDDDSSDEDTDSESNDKDALHFYDEFKMMLQSDTKNVIDTHMPLEALDGHTCPAINIFAMALKHLKKNLLEVIQQQAENEIKDNEIKWVLTVPAIWSDKAKQFMRECAIEAGIVTKATAEQLLIALEPEAASLYCRTLLEIGKFQVKENITKAEIEKGIPVDTHYMVVDCGGGTVDVTAHHFKPNGDICELYAASGGGWGGRNVNILFEETLNRVLSGPPKECNKSDEDTPKDFISECKKR